MRLDASLRREPSRLHVDEADPVVVDVKERIAPAQVRGVEHLVRQPVFLRGRQRAQHQRALGRTQIDPAGLRQQVLA